MIQSGSTGSSTLSKQFAFQFRKMTHECDFANHTTGAGVIDHMIATRLLEPDFDKTNAHQVEIIFRITLPEKNITRIQANEIRLLTH